MTNLDSILKSRDITLPTKAPQTSTGEGNGFSQGPFLREEGVGAGGGRGPFSPACNP